MKSKNGKYNMKGGNKNGNNFIGLLSNLSTRIINYLNNFDLRNLPGIILFYIVFILIIYLLYLFFINLITCSIISTPLFTVSLVIYILDILDYINEEYINKFTIFKYLNMALKKIVSETKNFFQIDNFANFVSNVSATKIFSVIMIIVGYIVSICFSAISFSSGRDIDMKPSSIIGTIIIYILTICSIIFINFAIGREITYKKIPHFLLKASTYTLLMLIAISCSDDNIFNISNILNLVTSSIILFILITILIYMGVKEFKPGAAIKMEKVLRSLALNFP